MSTDGLSAQAEDRWSLTAEGEAALDRLAAAYGVDDDSCELCDGEALPGSWLCIDHEPEPGVDPDRAWNDRREL